MVNFIKEFSVYRELLIVLAWKTIVVRYKQAYFGVAWAILKPISLVLIFVLVRSFVGIESGEIPYPILTFAALVPWIFFQESTSEGVTSIVGNANLIRKIYFPREVFPITVVSTKLVELLINLAILAGMMVWYGIGPTANIFWLPVVVLYTMLSALTIAFAGAAANVHFRDVGTLLPIVLSFLMYASPVIYPIQLVTDKLLVQNAAGELSELLYYLYILNPMAGIIDSFQNCVLRGLPPNIMTMYPGIVLITVTLPLSYAFFKRAERNFADVI